MSDYATGDFADVSDEGVESQADLALFLGKLLADFRRDPTRWENPTLDRFLDALAAVTADRVAVKDPTWGLVADLLLTATGYE